MTDDDVKAIATYLKSLPGDDKPQTPIAASAAEMMAGEAIYRDQCSACHGLDGKGVDRLFPSVANSSMARADDPSTVIRIVLRGARSVATEKEPTAPGMPSYGWQLNDGQVGKRPELHPKLLGQRRAGGVCRCGWPFEGVRRQTFRLTGGRGVPSTLLNSLKFSLVE